jgi:hypothetical protein
LPQNNLSAAVLTDNVERVLTDIDADNGNPGVDLLRHDALLVFGAPCQLQSLAGQEHGRTIPLADLHRRCHLGKIIDRRRRRLRRRICRRKRAVRGNALW